MDTPGDRLKQARLLRGFKTAKDAAAALGMAVATYQQHETKTRTIPPAKAQRYAAFFQTSPEWLLYGRAGAAPAYIPVVGYVAADAQAHLYTATEDHIETPAPSTASSTTRAILIESVALGALFAGWRAVFEDTRQPPTPELHGRLCVVQAHDSMHVCRLIRSQIKGRFHLISASADPLMDQEIVWASAVHSLLP
jgi:transcriptional regulator with XRE-family HTH domain